MHRRLAHRIKQRIARMVDQRAEGDGRIGRTEGGETDLRDLLAQHFRRNGKAMHVGKLALVGRHAVRREALDMLDRMHALAHGKADILGADIVLEVDEGLDVVLAASAFGSADHAAGPGMRIRTGQRDGWRLGRTRSLGRGETGSGCLVKQCLQIVGAVAAADADAVLGIDVRQEALVGSIEFQLAARLREHVHGRRPACAHQKRIDLDLAGRAAAIAANGDRADTQATSGIDHAMAGQHFDAERAASASTLSPGFSRASTMTGTETPAFFRSIAAS